MDIETLKIFCDLAQLKSFSKTAEKHLLSQSAVSQQLAQLELVHKCQLVDRRKRPIELTKAGELFYEACKDIVDRYNEFKNDLQLLQHASEESIRIGAIYSIGMHSLQEYVKKFILKYPKVQIDVVFMDPDEVYETVMTGDIDIGVVAVPKRDRRFEVYDANDEILVLVCHPKHPLASESQVDISKIQFENFIAFGEKVPTRVLVDGILKDYNISVKPAMEFDNIETIKRAVEINSGVSILPEAAIAQEVRNGTLKAIHFSNERFIRPTGVIVRKNKILSKAANFFIELLRKKED